MFSILVCILKCCAFSSNEDDDDEEEAGEARVAAQARAARPKKANIQKTSKMPPPSMPATHVLWGSESCS